MPCRCLLYYITDRAQFSGTEQQRRSRLLQKIAEAASEGVDYIQLREKDLPPRELETLSREVMNAARSNSRPPTGRYPTCVLINSRTDVALAVEADGVHLRSDDISARDAREIWNCTCVPGTPAREVETSQPKSDPISGPAKLTAQMHPVISVSCHSATEVLQAQENGADFAVLAPVFEKKGSPETNPDGLDVLRRACQYKIPVFALGGVTLENAPACIEAGAAGIAAIRLFQENDIRKIVSALRFLASP